jgi:hypothetical protein
MFIKLKCGRQDRSVSAAARVAVLRYGFEWPEKKKSELVQIIIRARDKNQINGGKTKNR